MENVLNYHIIVLSVGGKASTRMQPTDPTGIASEVGDCIGRGISHIGVHNSEGTPDSAIYLFETQFPNELPEV